MSVHRALDYFGNACEAETTFEETGDGDFVRRIQHDRQAARGLIEASRRVKLGSLIKIKDLVNEGRP